MQMIIWQSIHDFFPVTLDANDYLAKYSWIYSYDSKIETVFPLVWCGIDSGVTHQWIINWIQLQSIELDSNCNSLFVKKELQFPPTPSLCSKKPPINRLRMNDIFEDKNIVRWDMMRSCDDLFFLKKMIDLSALVELQFKRLILMIHSIFMWLMKICSVQDSTMLRTKLSRPSSTRTIGMSYLDSRMVYLTKL